MSKWAFWQKEDKQIKEQAETKSAVIGLNDVWSEFIKYGMLAGSNASTASGALSLYDKSTAVSIPINFIAECFSSIVPVVEVDGEIETNHPVLDLLNSPSPFFGRESLLEALGKYYLITNEIFIVALGSINRPPLEIQPISPMNADVIEGYDGTPSSMLVTGNSLVGQYVPKRVKNNIRYYQGNLRELKQIKGFSTKGNSLLRGQSLLKQASAEVRQHILGNTHNVSLLEKGGRVSLVFHFDSDLTPTEFEEVKSRVRDQYGGATNAGEIGVTAGGKLDIKQVGNTNVDMDFANLQDMAKRAVALQYKFPLPLLTTDAATLNNYSQAKLALYDDAVLPLADKIFGGLTELLMPRYGFDPSKVRITYNMDAITALASRRIDELLKRKNLNVETDNEIRSLIGREPYENGDIIWKPANLIPAGADLLTDDENKKPDPSLLRDN